MIVVLNTAVSRCEVSDGSAHWCRYGDPVGTGRTWYHCISKLECSNDAGRTQTYSLVVRNEGRTIGGDLQTGGGIHDLDVGGSRFAVRCQNPKNAAALRPDPFGHHRRAALRDRHRRDAEPKGRLQLVVHSSDCTRSCFSFPLHFPSRLRLRADRLLQRQDRS